LLKESKEEEAEIDHCLFFHHQKYRVPTQKSKAGLKNSLDKLENSGQKNIFPAKKILDKSFRIF
jgi:hypothetical protein